MIYADLCARIQETVENAFTDKQLAMFVKNAEQKIHNTVQLPALRTTASGLTLSNGNRLLSAPADFMSAFSFGIVDGNGNTSYLLNKDVDFIREAYPNATSVGKPKHYAIYGANTTNNVLSFIVGPTPDSAYTVELQYFFRPTSIVDSVNGTSWLGDNFDSVLLNASLCEAARFLKSEQDVIAVYDTMFKESLALLKNLGDGKDRQDTYRSGQLKADVK